MYKGGDSTFIILNVSVQWKIRNVLGQYCVCFVYSRADQMTVVLILLQRVSMWWCSSTGVKQCGVGLSLCQQCVHDFCMYTASLCKTPLRFCNLYYRSFAVWWGTNRPDKKKMFASLYVMIRQWCISCLCEGQRVSRLDEPFSRGSGQHFFKHRFIREEAKF